MISVSGVHASGYEDQTLRRICDCKLGMCASGCDWVVCCPFGAIFRCCDAQMAVVLKVSSSAHGGCMPSRPIACSGLQFHQFDACPFEVGFKVILVSLLGAPRIEFSFS